MKRMLRIAKGLALFPLRDPELGLVRVGISVAVNAAAMILIFAALPVWIALGLSLILAMAFLQHGLIRIPQKQHAIFNLQGKRWRVSSEGLDAKIPFLESCERYSSELDRIPISLTAKTKEALGIVMKGALEFVPDRKMLFRYDDTERNLKEAVTDSIKSILGALAGTKQALDFIGYREAIVLIINCMLRLKKMPHTYARDPRFITVVDGDPADVVPLEKRLDFYRINADQVREILDKESYNPEERSPIEEAYGIDVKVFDLTDMDYTEKTSASFEEEQQAIAKAKATEQELALVTKFKRKGASAQEAINAAQVSLGKRQGHVHSVEGVKGALFNVEGLDGIFGGGEK